MTPEQFLQELNRNERQLRHALERTIPLKVSVEMEEFAKENFRQGGFVDNGLTPWKRTLRQSFGKGEDASRTPLLSRNRNLMNSVQHRYSPFKATVYNDLEYADIHNEGGPIQVTERMKRFFWAKHIESKDQMGRESPEAEFWKRMALKKPGCTIRIPERHFLGPGPEVDNIVTGIIEKELDEFIKTH